MAQGQISKDNTRISIVLPKDLKDRADKAANKDGRSLASWIRKLITDALDKEKTKEYTGKNFSEEVRPCAVMSSI